MNKQQVNSVKKVIEHTRNAIKGYGFYMPSDAQTAALKALFAAAENQLGIREKIRFQSYLNQIDCANRNMVYEVCASERQLAVIEKVLAIAIAMQVSA